MTVSRTHQQNNIKSDRNIIYPIFHDCIQHTEDEFWKYILEELSKGKCPKSIYISNNVIHSSNKKKRFSYPIDSSKSSLIVFNELKELLTTHTSICSSIDIKQQTEQLNRNNDGEITNKTTWSEIHKKTLRDIFIINFIIRMKNKYKLSWNSAKDLYSTIQIAFLYKTQVSKDVVFKNKQIESINGISYDHSLKKFINIYSNKIPLKEKDEIEDKDKYLHYYWDKYVVSVNKSV